jgi:preprotein translocase subunit SecG
MGQVPRDSGGPTLTKIKWYASVLFVALCLILARCHDRGPPARDVFKIDGPSQSQDVETPPPSFSR